MIDLSIVTICKNDLEGLQRTIASITDVDWDKSTIEHLIIDGASTDGTCEYLSRLSDHLPQIGYTSEPDSGIYSAMNKGVRKSRGVWVIFLNAGDELLYDGCLATLAKNLPQNVFMHAFQYEHVVGGKRKLRSPKPTSEWNLRMPTSHQAMLHKRNYLMRYPFNEDYRICGDYESFLNIYRNSGASYTRQDIVLARFFSGGESTRNLSILWKESLQATLTHTLGRPQYWTRKIFLALAIIKALAMRALYGNP